MNQMQQSHFNFLSDIQLLLGQLSQQALLVQVKLLNSNLRISGDINRFMLRISLQKNINQLEISMEAKNAPLLQSRVQKNPLLNRGINPVRMSTTADKAMIEKSYELVRHSFEDGKEQAKWINFYVNEQKLFPENKFLDQFHTWLQGIIKQIAGPGFYIHCYGFIFTPKKSNKLQIDQEYHIDYIPQVCGVFIPLVPLNCNNATRFTKFECKAEPYDGGFYKNRYGKDDMDLLQREGLDWIETSQIVCKPFTILNLGMNTVHKGIANLGEYDRPMFNCLYSSKKDFKVTEHLVNHHASTKTQ